MFLDYKIGLIVGMVVLPFLVLSINNKFDSSGKTAMRFVFAIIAVWVYLVVSRFVVDEVDLHLAKTLEEIEYVYDRDGAKNSVVLFLGWLPGIFLATLSWFLMRCWHWFKVRIRKMEQER